MASSIPSQSSSNFFDSVPIDINYDCIEIWKTRFHRSYNTKELVYNHGECKKYRFSFVPEFITQFELTSIKIFIEFQSIALINKMGPILVISTEALCSLMKIEDDICGGTNLGVEHSATVETNQYVLKDHDSLKEGKKHEDIFKQHTW